MNGESAIRAPRPAASEHPLLLKGPAGVLEARLDIPARTDHSAVAVVCHPHPLYGGSLDNKVTATLARSFNERGIPVLRFNFRGVGASAGGHADGVGETEDLLAVIREAGRLFPGRALWLAGFSFGAYVALRALQHVEAAHLITVAPPVHLYDCADLAAPHCPWLLIQGRNDEVVSCKEVMRWVSRCYPAPRAVYLDGVGHYFHGRLSTLRAAIQAELAAHPAHPRRAG
jgi:alpha/beta superfamily hydrolase